MGGVGLVQFLVLVFVFLVLDGVFGLEVDDLCLRLRRRGGFERFRTGRRLRRRHRFGFRRRRLDRRRNFGGGWERFRRSLDGRSHLDGHLVAVPIASRCLRKRFLGRLRQILRHLGGVALHRAGLDVHLLGEPGEAGIGNDVADVEEGGLVQTDVDEGGLHSGKDPNHPSLVDVADYPFLVLALQVVLRDRPLFDQRHPGLLTRGVDHQNVRHRKFLFPRPRGRRATAAGRCCAACS